MHLRQRVAAFGVFGFLRKYPDKSSVTMRAPSTELVVMTCLDFFFFLVLFVVVMLSARWSYIPMTVANIHKLKSRLEKR